MDRKGPGMQPEALVAAYISDWMIGDPEEWPHPVRLFGRCISIGEMSLRDPENRPSADLIGGALLALGLPCGVALISAYGVKVLNSLDPGLAFLCEIALGSSCLATRNLLEEAQEVITALERQNLPAARARLSRIVGRDTANLDESEICRAVIETLAESLSDGILAPLFYLAVGGVPAALAYKSINTMDSMIGHREERYLYFGKTAARLDDVANFIPARISALLISLAAAGFRSASVYRALSIWIADGGKHKSPNAGQPESAMSGALGVRLGGMNSYSGELIESPVMGSRFSAPRLGEVKTAIKVTAAASILGGVFAAYYLWMRKK